MKEKFQRLKDFFLIEIWTADTEKASAAKRLLIRTGQTMILSFKSFKEDKLNVNASALTYFTMLSIVPVLALGFGIAKGFGLEAVLEDEIASKLAAQKEARDYILQFTKSMLNTTKGGLVAGVGVVILFWSVIKLLTHIENSFNTVWDVKKGRSILRKFTDYMSIVLLGPIFMVLSSSVTIFLSGQVSEMSKDAMFNFISPVAFGFAKLIPFVLIWVLFTMLYIVMPNTRVKFKSAFIAGAVAGTIFQVFQTLYVDLQSSFTRLNAIYGSFAALPLFLIWLQISWLVVLLGAEISFAVQNLKLKSTALAQEKLSFIYQKKLSLFILKKIIDRFKSGNKPMQLQEVSTKTRLPVYTAETILSNLHDAGLVSQVVLKGKKTAWQPAESIENLNLAKVSTAVENSGKDDSKFLTQKEFLEIEDRLNELDKCKYKSSANILLKDI